jgi:hypothetical protein
VFSKCSSFENISFVLLGNQKLINEFREDERDDKEEVNTNKKGRDSKEKSGKEIHMMMKAESFFNTKLIFDTAHLSSQLWIIFPVIPLNIQYRPTGYLLEKPIIAHSTPLMSSLLRSILMLTY